MQANVSDKAAVPFKDRKTGLVIFGALHLVLGGFCALGLLAVGLGSLVAQPAGAETSGRMMGLSMCVYLVMIVWFVCMGIGSILARRWARALILVSAWIWLAGGVAGMGGMLVLWNVLAEQMGSSGPMPQQVVSAILAIMLVFLAIIYLGIPGALILFYGSRHVRATCEDRNPDVCWTDRCPLPVLAASLLAGSCAVFLPISMAIYGWPAPCFGSYVYGWPGAGIILAGAALMGLTAWGLYRLDLRAWWCAVALVATWGISAGMTCARAGMMALYSRMDLPQRQLESMQPMAAAMDPWLTPLCFAWVVVLLVYLLCIRRFFPKPDAA